MLGKAEGFVARVACCTSGSRRVAGGGFMRRERDDGAVGEAGTFAE
jgi:hypothetical protein